MRVSSFPSTVYTLENVSLQARIEAVNVHVGKGQCWHFLGPNGAGKSSLLLLLAGIETPTQGVLKLDNTELSEHPLAQLAKTRCFLHQQLHCEFDIPLAQLLGFYTQSSTVPNKIDECLQISALLHKPLSALSGGQQQRFHIARNLCQIWPAILKGHGLILLDEPISHLDVKYQCAIMGLLQHLCELGNTVIMTSHDINVSRQYSSHIGLLQNQKLIFQGCTNDVLTVENLQAVFEHDFVQIDSEYHSQKFIVSASNQSI
ncbi:MAG: vitamin B12 transport system ATP-binding protein [Kangiellaceae bacterium]